MEVKFIKDKVCKYYGFEFDEIYSPIRIREIVQMRQIVIHFAMMFTNYNLMELASIFSFKTHGNVIHANKVVFNLMQTNKKYWNEINQLMNSILEH